MHISTTIKYRLTYSSHDAVIGASLRRSLGHAPGDSFAEITLTGRWVVDPINTVLTKEIPNINKISALVHGLNGAADVLESLTWERMEARDELKSALVPRFITNTHHYKKGTDFVDSV